MIRTGNSPTALALLRIGVTRLVAGLCVTIWLAAATAIWLEHGRIRDEMEENRASLSLSLAEHAERSLSEVELVLNDIARIAGHHNPPTREELQDHLRHYALMLPMSEQLTLTLADGTRLSAFPETAASPDFAALPPPGPLRGLMVGNVVPQADRHLLPLFHAAFASDGRRVGTVTAHISLDYFGRFYRSLTKNDIGLIGLERADGTLLMVEPPNVVNPKRGFITTRQAAPAFPITVVVGTSRALLARMLTGYALGLAALAALTNLALMALAWLAVRQLDHAHAAAIDVAASQAQLRQIIDIIPHMLFVKDASGRFLLVNKAVAKAFNTTVAALQDRLDAEVVPDPENIKVFRRDDLRVLMGDGTPLSVEDAITLANGEQRLLHTVKVPFALTGTTQRAILGISQDITERRKLDEELRRYRDHLETLVAERTRALEKALASERAFNEQQQRFVSMASHEFRTPLALIDSTAQVLTRLEDRLSREDRLNRYGELRAAVARLHGLIESILGATCTAAGTFVLNPVPCDLVALLHTVVRHQVESALSHSVLLKVPDGASPILADAVMIEQVLTNLIGNAIKYSPGGDRVEVALSHDAGYVAVMVRDYGRGIPLAELGRLFKKYFRASTSSGIPGTGLGLYLSRAVVEQHGGQLRVESMEGVGSTFTMILPIAAG